MPPLKTINGQIDQLQDKQVQNTVFKAIQATVDDIQSEVTQSADIAEDKKVSVLEELYKILGGISLNSNEAQVRGSLGHLDARVRTLGFIYSSAISDVMGRHLKSVTEERANDEKEEPNYIDEVEAEFGVQIHGDPGPDHIAVFRGALLALYPEERDLLDIVPAFEFTESIGPATAGAQPSTFTMKIDYGKMEEGAFYSEILSHEITHLKESLILLVERRQGTDTLDQKLNALKTKGAGPKPEKRKEIDVNAKAEDLASKYSLTPEEKETLRRALQYSSRIEYALDKLKSSTELARYMKFLAAAVVRADEYMPDPEKLWGIGDILIAYERIKLAADGGTADIDKLFRSDVAKYFSTTEESNDPDWSALSTADILEHIKPFIIQQEDEDHNPVKHAIKSYGLDKYESLSEALAKWAGEEEIAAWASLPSDRLKKIDVDTDVLGRHGEEKEYLYGSLDTRRIEALGLLDTRILDDMDKLRFLIATMPDSILDEWRQIPTEAGYQYFRFLTDRPSGADFNKVSPSEFAAYLAGNRSQLERIRPYVENIVRSAIPWEGAELLFKRFIRLTRELLASGIPVFMHDAWYFPMAAYENSAMTDDMIRYGLTYRKENNFSGVVQALDSFERKNKRYHDFFLNHYKELSESKWGEFVAAKTLAGWVDDGFLSEEDALLLVRIEPPILLSDIRKLGFNDVGLLGIRRYIAQHGKNKVLALKVIGLTEFGQHESLHEKLVTFLDIFKEKESGKVIKAAQDFLERHALESMRAESDKRFKLDDDGYVNRYGQTERTYFNQIHTTASLARLVSGFRALGVSHQIVIRSCAEKLSRLMKNPTVPPIDFKRAPIRDVINWLETALLHSDDVDIETYLEAESPVAALLLSATRLVGTPMVASIAGLYYDWTSTNDFITGSDVENMTSAMLDDVVAHHPITIGVVSGLIDAQVILRETVTNVKMLPEELSTIVEFYRHDPKRFRQEVFKKGEDDNYIHPKTVARVQLAQQYGLLPSTL